MTALRFVASRRKTIGNQRLYEIDGRLYPSVTSILSVVGKPALVQWAKRVAIESVRTALEDVQELSRELLDDVLARALEEPERQRDAAAWRGSTLHESIVVRIAETGEDSFGILRQLGLEPLATEYTVYSPTYGYAGTADVVCGTPDGTLALVDWKSGGVWPEHAFQIGAYRLAVEGMNGLPVVAGYVVGLREAEPVVHRVDLALASTGFLAALTLYQAIRDERLLTVS